MKMYTFRIPLVPRRPVSPDTAGGKGKADKGKSKQPTGETPPPSEDLDEKLLQDAHTAGYAAIDKLVSIIICCTN